MPTEGRLSAQALAVPTQVLWGAMACTKQAARRWAVCQYRRSFTVYRRRRVLRAIMVHYQAARRINHRRRSFSNLVVYRGQYYLRVTYGGIRRTG